MKKWLFTGLTLALFLGAALGMLGYVRWSYPYGMREACLASMSVALSLYAHHHAGWFPAGAGSPLGSLQLVYPDYLGFPDALAGISGDVDETIRTVKAGGVLDESVSSWIYWEGFRHDDDARLAILWERAGGVGFNGRRVEAGSHSVVFADGQMHLVSAQEWPEFVEEQELLRARILAKRHALQSNGRDAVGAHGH